MLVAVYSTVRTPSVIAEDSEDALDELHSLALRSAASGGYLGFDDDETVIAPPIAVRFALIGRPV